ncbi:histone deacetylase 11 [Hydra vulgaris]|uniref:histone deacetylase 11 n=1 Tax=Hydra vulgaris TaxID=6087 RepID=UPI000641374C|nr:histone deacetylase 11-like [Hydra vulgaris]
MHKSQLYKDIPYEKVPIIYNSMYNISFFGMEKLHPFDSGKWGRIIKMLVDESVIKKEEIIDSEQISETELLLVHTKDYLQSLKSSFTVARITEIWPVALLPHFIVNRNLLIPFKFQTGGTVLAAKVAMERGWAINIGGGFHHCSSSEGGGFCAYADITLAIKILKNEFDAVRNIMIIDLDAHQGNGHERDFIDKSVYIMDAYNAYIYPSDSSAEAAISRIIKLKPYTEDKEYLELIKRNLDVAFEETKPDFILYNAGTDILCGDPLGMLSVSDKGVIKRDEIVFKSARDRNIPIAMVTSGGYQRETARVIADSIINLKRNNVIDFSRKEQILQN